MKIQISFDGIELENELSIAKKIAPYADSLEVGSTLLYKYGISAIKRFRETFPDKIILADAKIVDRGKQTVTLLADAGADWITVMAGTSKNVIHSACTTAHNLGKKIMLDLLDASSLGQSALEAQSMGVDALLLHKPYDEDDALKFLDQWEMVRGNSSLPIYISGKFTRDMVDKIKSINPGGIVIGKTIVQAENPEEEAQFFKEALSLT
jgi:3-hexulose-6-phosphate synthase